MGKMEVILRTERRRKWTDGDRERILAECDEPGVTVRAVSERNQISESLIYGWRAERRQKAPKNLEPMRFISCGAISDIDASASYSPGQPDEAIRPRPARIAPTVAPVDDDLGPPPPGSRPGQIELLLPTGVRLSLDSFVNEKALARVLRTLRGLH